MPMHSQSQQSPSIQCQKMWIFLLLLGLVSAHAQTPNPTLSNLTTLQSQAPSGVIHLTDPIFRQILSFPIPRPFHFIIFFDARQLHSRPDLSLPMLKSEFALISKSFHANNPNKPFFFFEIEFDESQSIFTLFNVISLPHIRLIPPSATDLKTKSVAMKPLDYSGMADSMADFIKSVTGLTVGPITRPPFLSETQMVVIGVAILISLPFMVKKLISGDTIFHDKKIWMAGAIFVYFFSVSGVMFNIIRDMPMFIFDKQDRSKVVFFYPGSGMQLGTEGFVIGFLFTVVGLLMSVVTHGLVHVENKSVQRVLMVLLVFVTFWLVNMVVNLAIWKTGYKTRLYWPSSWQ